MLQLIVYIVNLLSDFSYSLTIIRERKNDLEHLYLRKLTEKPKVLKQEVIIKSCICCNASIDTRHPQMQDSSTYLIQHLQVSGADLLAEIHNSGATSMDPVNYPWRVARYWCPLLFPSFPCYGADFYACNTDTEVSARIGRSYEEDVRDRSKRCKRALFIAYRNSIHLDHEKATLGLDAWTVPES